MIRETIVVVCVSSGIASAEHYSIVKMRNDTALDMNGHAVVAANGTCVRDPKYGSCPTPNSAGDGITSVANIDRIRHAVMKNLSGKWPQSTVVLDASFVPGKVVSIPNWGDFPVQKWAEPSFEGGPCDPEVFYWAKDSSYYMQYTGQVDEYHSVEYLAKTRFLSDAPFMKFEGAGKWKVGSVRSKPILLPVLKGNADALIQDSVIDGVRNSYGLGQATTVVKGDTIYSWFMDHSAPKSNVTYINAITDSAGAIIRRDTIALDMVRLLIKTISPIAWDSGASGVRWFRGQKKYGPDGISIGDLPESDQGSRHFWGGTGGNGIVRWDPAINRFRYFYIDVYGDDSAVVRYPSICMLISEDAGGLNWQNHGPRSCLFNLPIRSQELGVGADSLGWLPSSNWEFVWRAPVNADSRTFPDAGKDIWRPSGLYHYSFNPADTVKGYDKDVATQVNSNVKSRFAKDSLLSMNIAIYERSLANAVGNELNYNSGRYGYGPAVVKAGGNWHVYYCAEPLHDAKRQPLFPLLVRGGL